MFQQARPLIHRFRYLIVGLLGILLIGTIGSVAFLHSRTSNQPEKVIANQGHSLLYISADVNGKVILSMVRTSDGSHLWQYHLSGDLETTGYPPTTTAQAVQIFNGIVYFVVALPSHLDPTSYQLIALHANNGQPLWQKIIPVPLLNLIGVVAGVICLWTSSIANQESVKTVSIYGYQADTGNLSWKRTLLDIGGITAYPYMPLIVDNMLCFINRTISTDRKRFVGSVLTTVQPENGQTLWSYQSADVSLFPLSGENGILIVYSSTGNIYQPENMKTHLFGLKENNGSIAWQQNIGILGIDIFNGGNFINIPAQDNVICMLTSLSNTIFTTDNILLTAIRVSDGAILWRQNVHTHPTKTITNFTRIGNSLYLELATSDSEGMHPHFVASSLTAWNVSTGAKRWQRDETQLDFAWQFSSLGGDSNAPLFWQQGPILYVLRPGDGSVQQHYSLPASSVLPLTIADGKAIFTYNSPQAQYPLPRDIHSLSFGPNQAKPFWDYHLQMDLYTIDLGP